MRDTTARFARQTRQPVSHFLGIALLVVLVLLLAWLQFEWLSELRQEEQARRRVALRVAATNYAESVSQAMNRLVERIQRAGSVQAVAGDDPLFQAVFALDEDGTPRVSTGASGDAGWLPATRAQLQQRLGRPLIERLDAGHNHAPGLLWLDPPAVVYCTGGCQIGALDAGVLGTNILGPLAKRMFADFGPDLGTAVTVEHTGTTTVLYPPDSRPDDFRVTDLERQLLAHGPVLGPRGTRWLLKVNHGGSSLEAVVAGSHLRNLLLSGGLLSVLGLGIGLVVLNARRQVSLAREHLYFAAGVSHELRTPLSVISAAADNLADGTVSEDPRTREYGALIQREVGRLKGMIENVLRFAQSASTPRPRVSRDIDMATLIREALESCTELLRDRELRLELADDLPTVRGDPEALRSALTNLVANAAQYASGGNWIRVTAEAVRVRPRGRALRVGISNPVAGGLDAQPKRLFEPFYRGQQGRSSGVAGTGIGLAVARSVAQQHGGGVSVDTTRRGSVKFTLLLPVHGPGS
jgi:signal transduction histidine kinase